MKTIREVIAVLDKEILSYRCRVFSTGPAVKHTIACLRRARQIVKASQRGSAKKKALRAKLPKGSL